MFYTPNITNIHSQFRRRWFLNRQVDSMSQCNSCRMKSYRSKTKLRAQCVSLDRGKVKTSCYSWKNRLSCTEVSYSTHYGPILFPSVCTSAYFSFQSWGVHKTYIGIYMHISLNIICIHRQAKKPQPNTQTSVHLLWRTLLFKLYNLLNSSEVRLFYDLYD